MVALAYNYPALTTIQELRDSMTYIIQNLAPSGEYEVKDFRINYITKLSTDLMKYRSIDSE